ncbi:hypothetical protein C8R46DRAFT_1089319 [Mycena filopes]|nr:hypothetical protein C8R46DRAFT_1089319 [Mycena filopes]
MSLHDFDSRAGLETMLLHFAHDSDVHSLPSTAALDGYIVVPMAPVPKTPDRRPLTARSHNIQGRPISRHGTKPAKLSSVVRDISLAVTAVHGETPLISRPSTPFQPLPPVLATSPLRLPSFLDLTLQSLDNESVAPSPKSESASPSPPPIFPLSIDIPSVSHPNSPYVPWPSPVRRQILRPLTPASQVSRFSRPYSRSGARAPEPESPPPAQNKFLRLSKSLKNLRRTVKQSVKHVKNALRKTSKARSPETVLEAVPIPILCPSPTPPSLPSPVPSCESTNTTSLAEWLRDCEANVERATPNFMSLEEYEERGSWRGSQEIQSPLVSDGGTNDLSESFPSPMSPTPGTDDNLFPHLSMHDIWPTPPRFVTPRGPIEKREREMSMPGGWNSLRDSPASYA